MTKQQSTPNLHLQVKYTLIILAACLALVSAGCNLDLVPADRTRADISLEEAQSLVPFAICKPTYLPEGVESNPRVIYHAEMGDPQDADIRLHYYRSTEQAPAVEIFQKNDVYDMDRYYADPDGQQVAISKLLGYLGNDSEKSEELRSRITTKVSQYQELDNLKHWVFEITEPQSLHANLIEWLVTPKLYRVYTRLPLEEAKKIARSLTDCPTPQPTATLAAK